MTTQQTIILIGSCGLSLLIGMVIGYAICSKDWKKNVGKVAKMGDHELFMKRHGLKK